MEFAARLGIGYVEVATNAEWHDLLEDGLNPAPFDGSVGVDWDACLIYAREGVHWAHIVHEAGHLVAVPQKPYGSDETEFLGWEVAVVKHLGLPMDEFKKTNEEYGVSWTSTDGGEEFYDTIGALPPAQFEALCEFYEGYSKRLGNVTADGVPVAHATRVFPAR